ncbi:hypothetical protein IWX91DRAFT_342348 [Phyllosticta citricarpa]
MTHLFGLFFFFFFFYLVALPDGVGSVIGLIALVLPPPFFFHFLGGKLRRGLESVTAHILHHHHHHKAGHVLAGSIHEDTVSPLIILCWSACTCRCCSGFRSASFSLGFPFSH